MRVYGLLAALAFIALFAQAGCKQDPCRAAPECKQEGRCTTRNGQCVAASEQDCKASVICRDRGDCELMSGETPGAAASCSQIKEGCPCGCDHSEQMAAELREEGPDGVRSVDETLRIIAKREDAGYITEAMVEHRLRMLGLRRELLPGAALEAGRGVPLPSDASSHEERVAAEDASLRASADLSVHGEATEIVRGRPKVLRSSFRVGLILENLRDASRSIEPPTLRGGDGVELVMTRWYVVGGDGAPWNGVLLPLEKKKVNVIGYARAPISPGTFVEAMVHVDGLELQPSTNARRHWSEPWAVKPP